MSCLQKRAFSFIEGRFPFEGGNDKGEQIQQEQVKNLLFVH